MLRCVPFRIGSTFESLKKAPAHKLRKFFYGHHCRSEQKIQTRIERIQAAQPLTRDSAVIEAGSLTVEMLARQLKELAPYIARYEKQIAQLFAQHPDSALFNNLPGAGDQLAPRLLSAFGSDRERFQSSLEAVSFFGIAPVTGAKWQNNHHPFSLGLSEIYSPILSRVC